MIKAIVVIFLIILTTALIWLIGISQHTKDPVIGYLVFVTQFIYGGLCYDFLKSMRDIPVYDIFWKMALQVFGKTAILMIIAIGLNVLEINSLIYPYVGLLGAFVCYLFLIDKITPKFYSLYKEAQRRAVERE